MSMIKANGLSYLWEVSSKYEKNSILSNGTIQPDDYITSHQATLISR